MNIFVTHSSGFDFKKELYQPIRETDFNKEHLITLPQETSKQTITKDVIKRQDLLIAEVSFPSTGSGIEMGWAHIFNVPILAIHKHGTKPSSSLSYVADNILSYNNKEDMVVMLSKHLSRYRQ